VNLQDEYFDLNTLVVSLNNGVHALERKIDKIVNETKLIEASGMSKMDKDYITVRNNDAIAVLQDRNRTQITKRDIVKHRVDFIEGLLCTKCGGRGKRYLDFKCEECNGTGLNNV